MGIVLRPYQQEAKNAVFEKWNAGTRKTLLVLPTGTGKTIVFASVTEECVRHGERVLILAHRGELLDQAADKIRKATGLGCSVEKAEQSCFGQWYRVTVGSVQTLMREKRLKQFPERVRTQQFLCDIRSDQRNTQRKDYPDIRYGSCLCDGSG